MNIKILFGLLLLSNVAIAQTQLMTNGDLNLPSGCTNGNNVAISSGTPKPCSTFSQHRSPSSCLPPNWERSHGTPHWFGTNENDGHVGMWSRYWGQEGEGMYGYFAMTPGKTYYLVIKLSNPLPTNGQLVVRALDNEQLPMCSTCTKSEPLLGKCGDAVPYSCGPNGSAAFPCSTYVPAYIQDIVGFTHDSYFPNQLIFIKEFSLPWHPLPSRYWDRLWIYPLANTLEEYLVNIDYVHIYEESPCGNDILYNQNAFICPKGNTTADKSITANCGSSASPGIFVSQYGSTKWEAEYMLMLPNFTVDPNPGFTVVTDPPTYPPVTEEDGVFEAVARPCWAKFEGAFYDESQQAYMTNYAIDEINDENNDGGTENRMGKSSSGNSKNTKSAIISNRLNDIDGKLTIHPNPTTGQLNITMPAPGDYEVKISNMLGLVVYQGKLKDEQQKQIQLESSLPSGNYTVQIIGKEVNHIEKIILTR